MEKTGRGQALKKKGIRACPFCDAGKRISWRSKLEKVVKKREGEEGRKSDPCRGNHLSGSF